MAEKEYVMRSLVEAVEELKVKFPNKYLETIELGTICHFDERVYYQSTLCISRSLGKRGSLISVDISIDSIKVSKKACYNVHNITWIQSDSIVYLKGLKNERFCFAFLDTKNDKNFAFEEFRLLLPNMIEGSILIVDDAGITKDGFCIDKNVQAQKGHKIWHFLRYCNADFSILPLGTQLKIVLDINNLKLIKFGLLGKRDE